MRTYHIDGSQPNPEQIFVFGSNQSGFHFGGAALAAHQLYGADWGVFQGYTGQSYAIPTMDERAAVRLDLWWIRESVERFIGFAREHPSMQFFVTCIGCGIAGHKDADIAPMFLSAPPNCSLPGTWRVILEGADPNDIIDEDYAAAGVHLIEDGRFVEYEGTLAEDCAAVSGSEILRDVFSQFNDIFGDGKLQKRERDFCGGGHYSNEN